MAGFEFPALGAGGCVERVQLAVVRSDVDEPPCHSGRRVDARLGDELPRGLAGRGVDPMNGFVAPAGTPKEIVDALSRAIVTALKDPAVRKSLEELGVDRARLGDRIRGDGSGRCFP